MCFDVGETTEVRDDILDYLHYLENGSKAYISISISSTCN